MVPNLQNPDSNNGFLGELEKSYRGVWIQAELLPSYPKRTFWVETTFGRFPPEWQPPETRKIKRLLHSFFEYATYHFYLPFLPNSGILLVPSPHTATKNYLCLLIKCFQFNRGYSLTEMLPPQD